MVLRVFSLAKSKNKCRHTVSYVYQMNMITGKKSVLFLYTLDLLYFQQWDYLNRFEGNSHLKGEKCEIALIKEGIRIVMGKCKYCIVEPSSGSQKQNQISLLSQAFTS